MGNKRISVNKALRESSSYDDAAQLATLTEDLIESSPELSKWFGYALSHKMAAIEAFGDDIIGKPLLHAFENYGAFDDPVSAAVDMALTGGVYSFTYPSVAKQQGPAKLANVVVNMCLFVALADMWVRQRAAHKAFDVSDPGRNGICSGKFALPSYGIAKSKGRDLLPDAGYSQNLGCTLLLFLCDDPRNLGFVTAFRISADIESLSKPPETFASDCALTGEVYHLAYYGGGFEWHGKDRAYYGEIAKPAMDKWDDDGPSTFRSVREFGTSFKTLAPDLRAKLKLIADDVNDCYDAFKKMP